MCRGKAFSCSAGLLVLFLNFTIVLQQTCATTNHQQRCAPSACGKITNISYPFRLKNDPATCGDSRYELACEDNLTVLSLLSGKYYVQAINYNNFTIRLVDPGIHEADSSSIPRYFLSSANFTDTYNYTTDGYDGNPFQASQQRIASLSEGLVLLFEHVIYLNCSNPVRDDPQYVDTAPWLNWHSKGYVYAIAGDLPAGKLNVGCRVKLVAATSLLGLGRDLYDYEPSPYINQTFSYPEIHRMLVYGFDVSWMNLACEEISCAGAEEICSFNDTSGNLQCSSLREGIASKVLRFAVDFVSGIFGGLLQIIGAGMDSQYRDVGEKIGVVTGRYVLPYITVRFILGIVFFGGLVIYTCRRKHISMYENIEDFLRGNTLMPIRYSYKEIKKMTGGFKDKLGEGGYGSVYKGKLRSGPFIAVKMLGKPKANGQEFISEVATIGRIHHTNVVRLIGFCVEGSRRALVYEFMSNGSLDRYIFSKGDRISLTYEKMCEISLGVARGIAYLHQGCDMQILHFDIKPHNILLDENFIPKVSDFGLAKLYPVDNSIVTLTAARGTIGYMAPELFYKNIGGVSYKADVYSFGMLLMEMASMRRNLNSHAEHSSQLYFPFWIYNQLTEKNEIEMEEVTREEMNDIAKKMFIVALWCIQLKPSDRPSMIKVVEMLEGDVENIEMPPKPSLYPNEMIQGDLENDSDQTVSNDLASSTSFLK